MVTAMRASIPLRLNPGATAVVAPAFLATMPRAIAADEALRLVPGVRVDNQADGERVHMSIRGQGILSERGLRGIKVLQDGIPLNDPSGFAPDLFDIDWSTVAKVEVLRGPGASLYGGGATAGVLNIQTSPVPSAAGTVPAPTAEARVGSHGFWKTGGQAWGRAGDLGYRISASHTAGTGYREHTAFHATNVYLKGGWQAGALQLAPVLAVTSFYNDNAEGLNLGWLAADRRQANPDAITFNEFQRTERATGGLAGSYALGTAGRLDFNGYFRATRYREAVPSSVQHRVYDAPGATLQLSRTVFALGGTHTVGAGGDVQWQWIDDFRHPNLGAAREGKALLSDQQIRQSGGGAFLFDRIELGGAWTALLNARFDRVTNQLTDGLRVDGIDLSGNADFDRATFRAGLTYSPTPAWGAYANWGQGFLPPATEELGNNPLAQGGFNTALVPALSHGEELGIRGLAGEHLHYDVALFHTETSGDFDRYRIPARPLETFYRNGGRSRRFGAELYGALQLGPRVEAEAAYTWSHFRYLQSTSFYGDVDGHILPNSPEHQLAAELSWHALPDLNLGAGTDACSRWFLDAGNGVAQAGYALFNARAAWRVRVGGRSAALLLQARNLTGVQYIAFTEPDPDGNSYQPGPERELFAGVRLTTR